MGRIAFENQINKKINSTIKIDYLFFLLSYSASLALKDRFVVEDCEYTHYFELEILVFDLIISYKIFLPDGWRIFKTDFDDIFILRKHYITNFPNLWQFMIHSGVTMIV